MISSKIIQEFLTTCQHNFNSDVENFLDGVSEFSSPIRSEADFSEYEIILGADVFKKDTSIHYSIRPSYANISFSYQHNNHIEAIDLFTKHNLFSQKYTSSSEDCFTTNSVILFYHIFERGLHVEFVLEKIQDTKKLLKEFNDLLLELNIPQDCFRIDFQDHLNLPNLNHAESIPCLPHEQTISSVYPEDLEKNIEKFFDYLESIFLPQDPLIAKNQDSILANIPQESLDYLLNFGNFETTFSFFNEKKYDYKNSKSLLETFESFVELKKSTKDISHEEIVSVFQYFPFIRSVTLNNQINALDIVPTKIHKKSKI